MRGKRDKKDQFFLGIEKEFGKNAVKSRNIGNVSISRSEQVNAHRCIAICWHHFSRCWRKFFDALNKTNERARVSLKCQEELFVLWDKWHNFLLDYILLSNFCFFFLFMM